MGYRVLFTNPRGMEDIVVAELRGLGVSACPRPFGLDGWTWATVEDPLELARLCYQARTVFRGILVLAEGKIRRTEGGLQDIYEIVKGVDWKEWLPPEATFCVRSKRHGEHRFRSPDIERISGQAIIDGLRETTGHPRRVRLARPDVSVRVDVTGDQCVVGIDFVGEEGLHRRGYRAYDHPAALNTVLAAAMVLASGWHPGEKLVDPMCGGGTILIEAALIARKVPGGFFRKDNFAFRTLPHFSPMDLDEQMLAWDARADWTVRAKLFGSDISPKHVFGAELNAERALVRDTTQWQILDIADLPHFFPKGGVDCLITNPPFGVRMGTLRKARELHRTLCQVAREVLCEGGRLTLITHYPEWVVEEADRYGFIPIRRFSVSHGNLLAFLLVLKRKGSTDEGIELKDRQEQRDDDEPDEETHPNDQSRF